MPKIDCSKKCRMTSAIRESEFCSQSADMSGDSIKYGCSVNMSGLPKERLQFLSCELWDLGLKDSCNTCNLKCINNQNPAFAKTLEERRKLENLVDTLKPNMFMYGINAEQVDKISKTYTDNGGNPLGKEAIKAAGFANNALSAILSGKNINLSYFGLYAQRAANLAKNMKNNKKN